eukprot:CAMPEP_0171180842 /NCGR_PEP_ID=MMETSP0790-20130122/13961_1 /TAXON_ID=2925 /ORGANISM="Alexandrium catenella, Strain OF101" /LENGTH=329 /DNA_ID=CAMNT_0011645779 /DNA_START=28 /DNA_END=1013 /DNA_ORIENTATION=-
MPRASSLLVLGALACTGASAWEASLGDELALLQRLASLHGDAPGSNASQDNSTVVFDWLRKKVNHKNVVAQIIDKKEIAGGIMNSILKDDKETIEKYKDSLVRGAMPEWMRNTVDGLTEMNGRANFAANQSAEQKLAKLINMAWDEKKQQMGIENISQLIKLPAVAPENNPVMRLYKDVTGNRHKWVQEGMERSKNFIKNALRQGLGEAANPYSTAGQPQQQGLPMGQPQQQGPPMQPQDAWQQAVPQAWGQEQMQPWQFQQMQQQPWMLPQQQQQQPPQQMWAQQQLPPQQPQQQWAQQQQFPQQPWMPQQPWAAQQPQQQPWMPQQP